MSRPNSSSNPARTVSISSVNSSSSTSEPMDTGVAKRAITTRHSLPMDAALSDAATARALVRRDSLLSESGQLFDQGQSKWKMLSKVWLPSLYQNEEGVQLGIKADMSDVGDMKVGWTGLLRRLLRRMRLTKANPPKKKEKKKKKKKSKVGSSLSSSETESESENDDERTLAMSSTPDPVLIHVTESATGAVTAGKEKDKGKPGVRKGKRVRGQTLASRNSKHVHSLSSGGIAILPEDESPRGASKSPGAKRRAGVNGISRHGRARVSDSGVFLY